MSNSAERDELHPEWGNFGAQRSGNLEKSMLPIGGDPIFRGRASHELNKMGC